MSLLGDLGTAVKNKLGGASVDNTVPRYDGTTCNLQGSGVTISDTNVVTASGGFVGNLTGNASTATTATTSGSTTGNAATATKLATARTINGVSFDGTANITIADDTKVPLNGTGASGTWNINITGSANTSGSSGSVSVTYRESSEDANNLTTNSINAWPSGGVNIPFNASKILHIGNNSWPTQLGFDAYENRLSLRTRASANGTWRTWSKIYTEADPQINITGNANTATNASTLNGYSGAHYLLQDGWDPSPGKDANLQEGMKVDFTYGNNAPFTGPLMNVGVNNYSMQFNGSYSGATNLAYRTKNGDNNTWNPWRYIAFTDSNITGNAATATALSGVVGSAPSYACRAWVNFNGTGTVAIRASGNVSSITDNGVGDYTINFTNAMPDANYAGNVFSNFAGGSAAIPVAHQNNTFSRTTAGFRFQISEANSYATTRDNSEIYVSFFR